MERYVLFVYTRPMPGQEADFSRWYNNVHLREVLQVPGFVRAARWSFCHPGAPVLRGRKGFLATYTIETKDIAETLAAFEEARRSMSFTSSLDPSSVAFELGRLLPV